ncbi:hypothetical protein N780_01840 [Pontibacillus chungwhensis BH030062]|uniref:VanZ-like domain-containing protein n=1 Tax=Pontibacillus chungwhensis BH030062 TaxID=1385513 RepID=A0A0A2UVJ8_9BACI|nr:VanZ family protein [Pontibacillus chungwhensis]KGP92307.1 hypothetical protein N780_01840 [Pontibacillus chungwhensis BH030062]
MKKYLLLAVPIFLYGQGVLFYFQSNGSLFGQSLVNLVMIIILLGLLLKQTRFHHVLDWIVGIAFVLYFCVLYHQTVEFEWYFSNIHYTPENFDYVFNSLNLLPFNGILEVLRNNPNAAFQISGNLIMLAPLAFSMLYFQWTASYKRVILYAFLCSAGIEVIQFLQNMISTVFSLGMGRSTDIDDIILNTVGAGIGIGVYHLWTMIVGVYRQKTGKSNMTA